MKRGGAPDIATATLFALLIAISGCADPGGPKAEFVERWLAERATDLESYDRRRVVETLLECEESFGVDALLLLAVMEEESGYDPRARGRRGARGLMQLRPATAREVAGRLGVSDDFDDPATNVRLGTAYLVELRRRFGSWEIALAAYNFGPRRIRQLRQRGERLPGRYVSRIRERHLRIRAAFLLGESRSESTTAPAAVPGESPVSGEAY